ncbi:MAG: DUF6580 family putative transport protein [Mucinivorans sp.]
MKTEKLTLRFGVITLIVLFAALSRLIPHPNNFAPMGAMALFGAAYYTKRYLMFLIPIGSMWVSDLVLNNVVYGAYFDHFVWFYSGSLFTYGAFALIVVMGMFSLKKISAPRLVFSTFSASVVFFVESNFGVWFSGAMYPHTASGLMACYAAGVPFFHNTILGDLVYVSVMFGVFELCARQIPQLQLSAVQSEK